MIKFNPTTENIKQGTFTGYLMSKDLILAYIENNTIIEVFNPSLMPIYLKLTGNFIHWLNIRCIDIHRTNSRLLRKALRISTDNEAELVIRAHGATITDSFWLKARESALTYKEVKRFSIDLSTTALRGKVNQIYSNYVHTPELTNIGSYEKCWIEDLDNKFIMLKRGTKEELFSEYLTYLIGEHLGMNMAKYCVVDDSIQTTDFTDNAKLLNFEPAYSIMFDNDDIFYNLERLEEFELSHLIKEYLDMKYLDCLVYNMDRHTFNYGFLVNNETGEVERLAPNFDNNLTLISAKDISTSKRNDLVLLDEFKEVAKKYKYTIPNLDKTMAETLIDKASEVVNIKVTDCLVEFILNAYEYI